MGWVHGASPFPRGVGPGQNSNQLFAVADERSALGVGLVCSFEKSRGIFV